MRGPLSLRAWNHKNSLKKGGPESHEKCPKRVTLRQPPDPCGSASFTSPPSPFSPTPLTLLFLRCSENGQSGLVWGRGCRGEGGLEGEVPPSSTWGQTHNWAYSTLGVLQKMPGQYSRKSQNTQRSMKIGLCRVVWGCCREFCAATKKTQKGATKWEKLVSAKSASSCACLPKLRTEF